jgi:hypothetical protein
MALMRCSSVGVFGTGTPMRRRNLRWRFHLAGNLDSLILSPAIFAVLRPILHLVRFDRTFMMAACFMSSRPRWFACQLVIARISALPTRAAKKHVFLLLGGLSFMNGWAASVASAGMLRLQSSLAALPDVEVTQYDWRSFKEAGDDIVLLPKGDIAIVIGYSGGGSRATWLANLPSEPKIDLMILYDPSPSWDMKVIGPNVKQAICYHNVTPSFFGLGGGVLVGNNTQIDTVDISENHMLVQTDTTLHQRTITEEKKIHR